MSLKLAVLAAVVAAPLGIAQQSAFHFPQPPSDFGQQPTQAYEFQWPIKDVAVIGAGVSGLLAYRALSAQNFSSIRVFERDTTPGGNWHYSDEIPKDVLVSLGTTDHWWRQGDFVSHIPKELPSHSTFEVGKNGSLRDELEERRRDVRLPKPLWKSLRTNTPAPQQQLPGFPWPPGVRWASHHSKVQRYLRAFASWLGISPSDADPSDVAYDPASSPWNRSSLSGSANVVYNTRVELITKHLDEDGRHRGWDLTLHKFGRISPGKYEESYWTEHFDAVVVAAGRFNIPHIPAITGLASWQERFPAHIRHSRQYRYPDVAEGKNVLVVGASASATGISIDTNPHAKTSFLSVRDHSNDPRAPFSRELHLNALPTNTTIIGEIKAFHPIPDGGDISEGKIELFNGTIISGIDEIFFGTGFRYSFPFIPQYHNTSAAAQSHGPVDTNGGEQPIVTDGTHVRSLYLDVFYIDQPTLAFLGQNVGIQTFVYGKYAAEAVSRVWAGKAHLPPTKELWAHFWNEVESRGGLKAGFQWFNAQLNSKYLRYFVAWLNAAAVRNGDDLLDPPPDVSEQMDLWLRARAYGPPPSSPDGDDFWSKDVTSLGVGEGSESWNRAIMDDW